MRLVPPDRLFEIMLLAAIAAGCSSGSPAGQSSPGGSGGEEEPPATGGSSAGGKGGQITGGSGGIVVKDADVAAPDTSAAPPDANTSAPDTGSLALDSNTPMNSETGAPPSYEGEIPIHYGPEVGPVVMMNCPGDPTEGWTEYADSFHLEHPYRVAANTRFSITGGVYNFWVFPNDSPHSPQAMGRNPRTEATYGGLRDKANVPGGTGLHAEIGYFTTGKRLYSADMLITSSAVGSAIMQIHTTASGGGPIGLRINGGNMVNNGSLTVVQGSSVPGGLVNKWFNFKASFDTATRQVQIFINNCLKSTYTGARGDGKYYFKNGVYFCDAGSGCRTHFKNVHLYEKP
jgi:hypothetical protein